MFTQHKSDLLRGYCALSNIVVAVCIAWCQDKAADLHCWGNVNNIIVHSCLKRGTAEYSAFRALGANEAALFFLCGDL